MALYGPSTATASVAANTNVVTITGMDLTIVTPGMTINFGARDRKVGDAYIIGAVTPSGTNGGTLTTAGSIPTAYNNAAFIIDTTGYLGTDASYAAATSLSLLQTLATLFGPATNLYSGARQIILDKLASTALGRIGFAIQGRTWGDIVHRALSYTPTGGQQATVETLALRAFPDGTTPQDVLTIDLTTGAGDLRAASVTMASAATVDLGSAPMKKVAITGSVTITSFGSGRHLERIVHVVDGGGTLTHNATTLILPGAASIFTRAGDRFGVTSDGSGNWRVIWYTRADGTPLVLPVSTQRASFRNRLVNGTFAINQRGAASASTTYPAGTYILDRWKAGPNGVTLSFGAFAAGAFQLVTITAGTLMQVIEGGRYLPEGGNFILSWSGSAPARIYQGSAAGTFVAGPVTATLAAGVNAVVEFGTGTVTRAQLEAGDVATPFEWRDDEERRCQRYYQVLGGNANADILIAGWVGNTQSGYNFIAVTFAFAPMRTVPTPTRKGTWYGLNVSGNPVLSAGNGTVTMSIVGASVGYVQYNTTLAAPAGCITLECEL